MIIIPGEPEPKPANSLLTTDLFRGLLHRIAKNSLRFHQMMRIAELRRSCSVTGSNEARVSVRLPYRYQIEE